MKKHALPFIAMSLLFASSCATNDSKPKTPNKPHPKVEAETRSAPVVESTETDSPERQASDNLVDQGQMALDHGLYDRSGDLFQEAVKVDPSNGAAYYYLAVAKLRSGEYGEAESVFEKAQGLLGKKSGWVSKIEDLRNELNQKKPK